MIYETVCLFKIIDAINKYLLITNSFCSSQDISWHFDTHYFFETLYLHLFVFLIAV